MRSIFILLAIADYVNAFFQADIQGVTPFLISVKKGRESAFRILLSRPEINVNAVDGNGRSALYWAALNGREQIVRYSFQRVSRTILRIILALRLLISRRDVDVNLAGVDNETPLFGAVKRGRENIVR